MAWEFKRRMLTLPPADNERGPGQYIRLSDAFIDELAKELAGKRVLEVFAGNGLLGGYLLERGVDIVSTTIFSGHDGNESGLYSVVHEMEASQAVEKFADERDVLLMAWPTVTTKAFECAQLWSSLKGEDAPICFIGERTDYAKNHFGGCADDQFHELFVETKALSSYKGNIMEVACLGKMPLAPELSRQKRLRL